MRSAASLASAIETYLALCPRPTEELVADELRALPGVSNLEIGQGVVSFSGTREAMYRANLHLRCSSRVLLRLGDERCGSAEELYEVAAAIPWERYLDPRGTLAVSAHGTGPGLANSMYTAVRVKDAVVDRLRSRFGTRPDVDVHNPSVRINVQLYAGSVGAGGRGQTPRVAIALDSSEQPLYQRGYRAAQGDAPLKETLAAAILRLAQYGAPAEGAAPVPVIDLCCGSGTLLAEAGLLALSRAPGRRRRFGFMRWPDFDARLFQSLCAEADAAERKVSTPFLFGSDIDARALSLAKKCLDNAGLLSLSRLRRGDLREAAPPTELSGQRGIVVVNPPYGQRLGDELELVELYRGLGDTLKRRFAGYTAFVFTGSLPLARQIGLRPSARHVLYNGDLEGRLLRFDLY